MILNVIKKPLGTTRNNLEYCHLCTAPPRS